MIAQSHSVYIHVCITGLTLRAGYSVVHTRSPPVQSSQPATEEKQSVCSNTCHWSFVMRFMSLSVSIFPKALWDFFSIKEQRCLISGKYFWIIIIIFVNYFPPIIFSALSPTFVLLLTFYYLYVLVLFWQLPSLFHLHSLFCCFILWIWGLLYLPSLLNYKKDSAALILIWKTFLFPLSFPVLFSFL